MRDAVNKAAKLVIQHCLDNDIGTIVMGWNKGQKQSSNMGKKNNQKFVQIPTAKLKSRIEQLCNVHGIRYLETEESYTSKASSLDLDSIPVYGEKPARWKPSGRRVKRGLYRSASGIEFNADINGAIGIARKVAKQYEFDFDPRGFARGVLTMPRRLRFWCKYSNLSSAVKESLPLKRQRASNYRSNQMNFYLDDLRYKRIERKTTLSDRQKKTSCQVS